MGRWRPPTKQSSPYITADGAKALHIELKQLWGTERREVVKALTAAAAEGDRSENAEYIYRKRQLAGIDRRIRYLSKRLDVMQVVDRPPADTTVIRFGAYVKVRELTEKDPVAKPIEYRIVGADEIDSDKGWISIDSPVAMALLGKRCGDNCFIQTPENKRTLEILSIHY